MDVECHGGLTYAERCDGSHICHVPAVGEPDDVFWFGFDCHHAFDIAPGYDAAMRRLGVDDDLRPFRLNEMYRDMAYARHEVEHLAEQFAARA